MVGLTAKHAISAWSINILTFCLVLLDGHLIKTSAQEIETLGSHCNDAAFGSDGGGISGCIELAIRRDEFSIGLGVFGVTPEQKKSGSFRVDPLEEKGRMTGWIAHEGVWQDYEYSVAGRIGAEGGVADDVALSIKEELHKLFGYGNRELESQNSTQFIVGVSGSLRKEFDVTSSENWNFSVIPYAHGTAGIDAAEAGAGLMLQMQPMREDKNIALVLPKTGAYSVQFGGDGIALFGGVRAIAHEGLYEDLANPFMAEVGITSQRTFPTESTSFGRLRLGFTTSCTTKPYDGASDYDCKMNVQIGGLF